MPFSYRFLLLGALLLMGATQALAQQNVGIGTATPDAKAALDISATDKGLLIPRLDSVQRTAISAPPDGLMVFQTDGRKGFWYAIGGTWLYIPDKTKSGDNLGSHTATQNLNLNSFKLTGGGTVGLRVGSTGTVTSEASISMNDQDIFFRGTNGSDTNHGVGWYGPPFTWAGFSVDGPVLYGFTAGVLGTRSGGAKSVLMWNSSGNVGIGTTSPGARLDVAGTLRASGSSGTYRTYNFPLDPSSATTLLAEYRGTTGYGPLVRYTGAGAGSDYVDIGQNRNGDFAVQNSSGSRLTMTQSGNLGIGTTAPTATLEVAGGSSTVKLGGLAGTGTRVVTADATGNLAATVTTASLADNLGNHTATQNLNLGANALVGTGTSIGTTIGVGITSWGGLNLGQNTTGNSVYVGYDAGLTTTSGARNLLVGFQAGRLNSSGSDNTLLGFRAGVSTSTGSGNLFIGANAGNTNSTGSRNVYLGATSGQNSTGTQNTFVGYQAGSVNTTGSNNWALGYNAGPGVNSLTNAGAIGTNAVVMQSNSLALGGTGVNAVSVGIGTPTPAATLHVAGASSTVQLEGLTGTGTRVVTADATGNLAATVTTASLADNLGNHTATTNLNLGANLLVGNGGSQGLAITSTGKVGLGVTNPSAGFAQLGNTSVNMLGADGQGGNFTSGVGSLAWAMNTNGFAGLFYNGSSLATGNGLAVKVDGTNASASVLDVSKGAQATTGTSLLMVKASGNVGIGTNNPQSTLDVVGNVKVSGTTTATTYTFPNNADDSGPVITSRLVPATQGGVNPTRQSELIVFHSNDGTTNVGGPDQITLRAPQLSFQTYNNTAVSSINDDDGYNARLTIAPTGDVLVGSLVGTGTRMVTADATGTLSTQAIPVDTDTDAQQLTKSGATISLTNGGSVTDADNQDLTLSGASLSISGGTGITLPDADATNELQTISKTGNVVTLSNGGGSFTDTDTDTDAQTLSISGATVSLTNGGSVTLPDADATNELQTISKTGSTVTLSNGGGSFTDTDTDTDAQTLSVSGGNLSISGGNSVPLTSLDAQQLTKTGTTISLTNGGSVTDDDNQNLTLSGAALNISGGTGITLPDADATNELQTISKTGNTVTLSNGGGSFTDTDTDAQALSISGSTISLTNGGSVTVPSSADNLGNHTATQNLKLGTNTLTGNGGSTGLQISANGRLLTTADNLVVGKNTGNGSLSGINNTVLGAQSGAALTTGSANTFTGVSAGLELTTGVNNSFYGLSAGAHTTTGDMNVALGHSSGSTNVTGIAVTTLGAGSDVIGTGLLNATAVGSNAKVSQSNSLVLGGTGTSAVNVGIGTTAPAATLEVAGATSTVRLGGLAGTGTRVVTADASGNLSTQAIPVDTDQQTLSLSGQTLAISGGNSVTVPVVSATNGLSLTAGAVGLGGTLTGATTIATGGNNLSLTGTGNVGIGATAGTARLLVSAMGTDAITATGSGTTGTWVNLTNTTTGGATWNMISTGSANSEGAGKLLIRDAANGVRATIDGSGNFGLGTTTPATKLDVAGGFKLGSNGTTLAAVIKATVNVNVPNVVAGSTQTVTFTVTNAAVGASAFVSPSAALANGLVMQYARVSAANTVEVKFHNPTGADINPAAQDYYLTVIQ